MKLNENTKILGQRVILVPYEREHVEKYHEWMQDPDLQQLTASEPLTLQQEYDMQRSWRQDEDKLTFLVLCRATYDAAKDTTTDAEIQALVGDTNLFLQHEEVDGDDGPPKSVLVAEAEIMIAEKEARGKGFGWEAMLLLMKYAQLNLHVYKFIAKIGMDNERSLRMFGKMQFREVGRSEIFREITMERIVSEDWIRWLDEQVSLQCEEYKKK